MTGATKDIGARYAFQKNQDELDLLSYKKVQNIIAIYLGNWFDFPYIFGMSRFIDILDWIKSTIKYALKQKYILVNQTSPYGRVVWWTYIERYFK